ncbi:MAG: gamma-polyglutamate biosynthesis protein CapC [Gammaproteobacteria bacterium]|nr:gamma-polyglutamate biosynthesis protein CapC [Gammaproteobacteria bacterium]
MLTAALIIGVAVSLLLTEIVGLSPGGIIVPGYVALLLDRPAALLGFLIIAFAAYGILRVLGTQLMLYGSRRFTVAILAGMALSLGAQWVSPMLAVTLMPNYVEWAGIGFIVPGLLAHQFDRQGVLPTLAMLAIAAPLVRVVLILVVPR